MGEAVCDSWGMFEQSVWDDPYGMYASVRDDAPVRPVTLFDGRAAWLVTGYEASRHALSHPALSKDFVRDRVLRPDEPPLFPPLLAKRHMLNSDPPDHSRLRGLVNRAFTPRRVESLRGRITEITDDLLAAMPERGTVDLIEHFAFPLPIAVICELLGVPTDGTPELRALFATFMANVYLPDRVDVTRTASDQLDRYLLGLIEGKRRDPGDDLLSAIIAARDDTWPKLDDDELLGTTFILVIAGHETTVNLIGNGMVALLRHPDQMAALRSDPGLLPGAVQEFLRFEPPIQHATTRVSTAALVLEGVDIPAGSLVIVNLAAANRDPAHFECPERLDVGRTEGAHLAFGHGIHYCVGAPLALLETEIAIGSLLAHYPSLRLAVPDDELHWRQALTQRSLPTLPLEVATGG